MTALASVSPELKLILFAARAELCDEQAAELRSLAAKENDWERLLRLAAIHGLRPLLYQRFKACCLDLLPEDVIGQLRRIVRLNLANAMLLTGELRSITGVLEAGDIPVMQYKGVVLGEQFYGDAGLRETGDIDIIVPRAHVTKAKDLLLNLGYRPLYQLTPRQEQAYLRGTNHYNLQHTAKPISVEVHWDIISPHHHVPLNWPAIWQRRQSAVLTGGWSVCVPAPEDRLLILLIHGGKHRWEKLKWLADVARFLSCHPNLDWSIVRARAEAWRVNRLSMPGLYLVGSLLGAPLPDSICDAIRNDDGVVGLSHEILALLDRTEGIQDKDLSRIAYQMRTREHWQDRVRYGWRLLTDLNFQDIDQDDRLLASYYLNRPARILRKNGWQSMTQMLRQMAAALPVRRTSR